MPLILKLLSATTVCVTLPSERFSTRAHLNVSHALCGRGAKLRDQVCALAAKKGSPFSSCSPFAAPCAISAGAGQVAGRLRRWRAPLGVRLVMRLATACKLSLPGIHTYFAPAVSHLHHMCDVRPARWLGKYAVYGSAARRRPQR